MQIKKFKKKISIILNILSSIIKIILKCMVYSIYLNIQEIKIHKLLSYS